MQLINGISNNLQKLLRYFSETTFFVFFTELFLLLTTFAVFCRRASLYLNDLDVSILRSALLAGTSSLLNFHKLPGVSDNCHYIRSNYTYALQCKYGLLHQ